MEIKTLDDLLTRAAKQKSRSMAVAAAEDKHVLIAVKHAYEKNIIEPVLIGNKDEILKLSEEIGFDISSFRLIDEHNPALSAVKAVELVKNAEADILMKGNVSTAPLLKAVLNKEKGLGKRDTLSHFALFQSKHYKKLFAVSDAAMNIAPELQEKLHIIQNSVEVFHSLDNPMPKVAVLGPVEVVNPKISSTMDAATLSQMNKRKQITGCIIDGPLAIDNAVSTEAVKQKNIISEVGGDADILIAPDLNSGNILYKTLIFLSDGISAAVILGAMRPIVLTSKADSELSKLYSIALAASI